MAWRLTGVGLVTSVLSLTTTFSAGAAVLPAKTATTSSSAALADWNDPYGYGGSSYGDSSGSSYGGSYGDGTGSTYGQSQSSSTTTTTVNSTTATKAQSTGVVLINTVLGYQDASAAGTGIVLTSNGEVLTNYHVVEGATSIKVTIASTGKTYTGTVVGHDQTDDVALVQLKSASGLTTAAIDDDTVAAQDAVTAVGNAGGTNTLSAAPGTVTALSTSITTESESGVAGESLQALIETSADVVPGDSGGPLLDSQGEVIGIDTAASSGTEINGYAIPISRALTIVQQILTGDETSTVQIGAGAFLGVEVSSDDTSTGSTQGYGYGQQDTGYAVGGATVAGVVDASPAAKAGLAEGDTITAIGGTTITSADQVTTLLKKHEAGDSVKITWTDTSGTSHTKTVTLATSPVA